MPEKSHNLPRWAEDVLATLPPFLSREQAATTLNCSRKSIDRRAREGALKTIRNGGRIVIPRLSLVEFLVGRSA